MNDLISTIEIAFFIILPLIIFYQTIKVNFKTYTLYILVLYLIWFLTYSLFHESCHLLGSWITGAKITDYQLIPHFWEGDFKTGFVKSEFINVSQSFISPASPYFRDITLLIIGYILLKRKITTNSFLNGLILILFLLSPLYDLFNNYFAFVMGYKNDFYAIAITIGHNLTHAMGVLFISIAVLLIWKVFLIIYNPCISFYLKVL